jgi:hypothetical protein
MKIVYEKGQVLGKHGVIFLEELEEISRKDKEGYKANIRQALFLCGMCGSEFKCRICSIQSGNTKSCGCVKRKKHCDGLSVTSRGLYNCWTKIKERCLDKNNKNYGGRGIKICIEWKESFLTFHDWAVNNGYRPGLQIDRRNNDGDYMPSNCRFVPNKINQGNKRTNVYCLLSGDRMIIADAAKLLGKSPSTLAFWAKGKYVGNMPSNLVFEAKK